VIVPGLGSWVLLGCVLTTASWHGPELPAERARWDACGSCTRCLDACPTGAFVAPGELDPRRCISYLTIEHRGPIADELADAFGERLAGCDVCQEVCPYNATPARETRVPDAAWIEPPPRGPRGADPWRLIDMGSATYRAWVKGTPVRRIARRSMRRNALLVLGNRVERWDEAQRARVVALVDHEDPQIAAAARRALARHDERNG
jgi:epoxyqueuosine reductase